MAEIEGTSLPSLPPELVEMILMQLPLPDVLLAQRVDKTWKGIIQSSPQLQRTLFFKASSTPPLRYVTTGIPDAERVCDFNTCWVSDDNPTVYHENIIINPLIAAQLPWLLGDLALEEEVSDAGAAQIAAGRNRSSILRPDATWRKMLFSQPSVGEVEVDDSVNIEWQSVTPAIQERGVTLQDVDAVGAAPGRRFCQMMGLGESLRLLEPQTSPKRTAITADEMVREMAPKPKRDG
ncbi:hypothetical protein LTR85_007619 [Meristemomyces frigidus]|nr:hypothetical protein LTR85_007619 [Meristemomyces frigidus]